MSFETVEQLIKLLQGGCLILYVGIIVEVMK